VPGVIGLHLKKANAKVAKARCKLGKVGGPKKHRKRLVVVKQSPKRGVTTSKKVALKLGKRKRRH
jgi:beta-lactam-binding protein with PASTA domain